MHRGSGTSRIRKSERRMMWQKESTRFVLESIPSLGKYLSSTFQELKNMRRYENKGANNINQKTKEYGEYGGDLHWED